MLNWLKNKNELNRFLIDNQQKSEIIKNKNEHEHQITLQKLEDKFNLDMKHLNNIQDEKINLMLLKIIQD